MRPLPLPTQPVFLGLLLFLFLRAVGQSANTVASPSPSPVPPERVSRKEHCPPRTCQGASLVVQWLRLQAPGAGDLGSVPGQGTRTHMPQLSIPKPQLKIPRTATETPHSQMNIF